MTSKTFTLEEANGHLPQIEELLDEMRLVRDQIAAQSSVLQDVMTRAPNNGGNRAAGEYLLLLQRFNTAFSMLQEIGCELKDLNQGLIDFPTYREGELVYLCWKRGEPSIGYWHPLGSGFAGRKPI